MRFAIATADKHEGVFHALMATDLEGDNVRVVTMYLPDPDR